MLIKIKKNQLKKSTKNELIYLTHNLGNEIEINS